jgi:DNA polymerase-3 subunit alpha
MKQPKLKFVNLHGHSCVGSPFDAIGFPDEHMSFAHSNGCDAIALTDHGNMNGLSYQYLHWKKMKSEGKNFKAVYGVEAYFHPSIKEWKEEKARIEEDKKRAKELAKNEGMSIEDEGATRSRNSAINHRRHLVLLAQNQTGLNNLFSLVSKSHQGDNYYRFPRVDYEMLREHSEGVIATSACLGGFIAKIMWEMFDQTDEEIIEEAVKQTKLMLDIFEDRFFLELQWNSIPEQHRLNQIVVEVSKRLDVPLVSAADAHYPRPELWKDRILYKKLGWMNKKDQDGSLPESIEEVGYELYPKNGDQMWDSYVSYSKQTNNTYDDDLVRESIERTHWIAHSLIEDFEPDATVRLPDFVVPDGETAESQLVKLSIEGMKEFGFTENEEYIQRLREELEVIKDRGFAKYFLTMKAIADKANEMMLSGPGRGSAAGSLLAYILKITQVDPIKHGLLFSRFMTKDATDYPDIDFDVSRNMELKEVLAEEWGEDSVVPISNYNTLKLRSLIKDVAKFYGIPYTEANKVTSVMIKEATPLAKAEHGITAGMYVPTYEETLRYSESLQNFLTQYPQVGAHLEALLGQVRSVSRHAGGRHAGGVVVGDDLKKHMPLIASGGVVQTPWSEGQNVRHLEPLGFIKFDVLGLTTLAIMEGAIYHILRRHHGIENPSFHQIRDFYDQNLHPDVIDLEDQKVYKDIFQAGKWAGIFQFANEGAQKLCSNSKVESIIDLSAVTSIYRPGPLSAGVDKDYIEAKDSPQYIKYDHPIIREILEPTYGFMIFQEQIAQLAAELGKDLTLDDGNKLRKLLTKKGLSEKKLRQKEDIRQKFLEGCYEKGYKGGEELWRKFEYFSGYGFNKSHAVCYSIISYQCAWLYKYFPSEWMAAFLDAEPDAKKEAAIATAKGAGFNVEKININSSGRRWEISEDGETLYQPLSSIKGLGDAAIDEIMANRPFHKVEDLLFSESISYSKLNKKALDVLCRAQALNSLVDERFTGLKHFWSAVCVDRPKIYKKIQKSHDKLAENIKQYAPEGDFSDIERIEYLDQGVPPISEFDPELIVCWFIPRKITERKTKKGKPYWIVDVTDSNSEMVSIKCWAVKENRMISSGASQQGPSSTHLNSYLKSPLQLSTGGRAGFA